MGGRHSVRKEGSSEPVGSRSDGEGGRTESPARVKKRTVPVQVGIMDTSNRQKGAYILHHRKPTEKKA